MRRLAKIASIVALGVACTLIGCEKKKPAEEEGQTTTKEQGSDSKKSKPEGPPKAKYGDRIDEANKLMDRIVSALREHFTEGELEDATFPGGTSVIWKSSEEPPAKGATVALPGGEDGEKDAGVDAGGDAGVDATTDADAAPSLATEIGLEPGMELPAQIIYETGEKAGAEASATVTAVVDFDPTTDANHTIEQELSVDPKTGDVNVFPRLSNNEWK